ncbi:MAG: hypothetical protein KatS3mg051_1157 [Anaerolineae bacterium]|nr:MAG: hypothetical protein KatS3mg051_1157 [Anaerolineae bacterium]
MLQYERPASISRLYGGHMSVEIMTRVWRGPDDIRGAELLLLLALADFANSDGYCYPSHDRLATMVRCSRRHVIRLTESLESRRLLFRIRRRGRNQTNEYIITLGMDANDLAQALVQYGDMSAKEARDQAMSFLENVTSTSHLAENVTTVSHFPNGKNVTSASHFEGENVTQMSHFVSENVTSEAEKCDIAVSHDPSIDPILVPEGITGTNQKKEREGIYVNGNSEQSRSATKPSHSLTVSQSSVPGSQPAQRRGMPGTDDHLPGLPPPRQRREKVLIDGLMAQVRAHDMEPSQFRELVDHLLTRFGKLELANSDTSNGTRVLSHAQETTLDLVRLGYRTPEAIDSIFESWRRNDYRGDTMPTSRQLLEHAAHMRNGMVQCTRKDKKPEPRREPRVVLVPETLRVALERGWLSGFEYQVQTQQEATR